MFLYKYTDEVVACSKSPSNVFFCLFPEEKKSSFVERCKYVIDAHKYIRTGFCCIAVLADRSGPA